jgi:hypothetical protein
MTYQITNYSKAKAKNLGVTIKPSTNKNKKIDVFKNEIKVATIGDINYNDYPTYLILKGKRYADERKRLYHLRHCKYSKIIDSNGYYAAKIL